MTDKTAIATDGRVMSDHFVEGVVEEQGHSSGEVGEVSLLTGGTTTTRHTWSTNNGNSVSNPKLTLTTSHGCTRTSSSVIANHCCSNVHHHVSKLPASEKQHQVPNGINHHHIQQFGKADDDNPLKRSEDICMKNDKTFADSECVNQPPHCGEMDGSSQHVVNVDAHNYSSCPKGEGCAKCSHHDRLDCTEQCDGTVENLSSALSNLTTSDSTVQPDSSSDIEKISYVVYESEKQMPDIMRLITKDLSEPYSIYTYRYFIHNWPKLCFLAMDGEKCVGAIVCKLDMHKKMVRRGYIAMLAVDESYRRKKIGSFLVLRAIRAMVADDCDEVVLETEITNKAALRLYENLGFVRDKRLFRYYLNGVDALRLKLWLR